MNADPVICFGQQPCGIFPRRYLYAKLLTARRLRGELGGRIVFFYHDSDHDPRETRTPLRDRHTGVLRTLNFDFENKLQRKYTPLYLKRIPAGWQARTARRLPALTGPENVEIFSTIQATTVADFCLLMYRRLGLLDGVDVVRSSDPQARASACDVEDFFVDLPYSGEIVRARYTGAAFQLHAGGDSFIELPAQAFDKRQVSPTRDTRLRWMQSIVHCTHYIAGAGEQAYLHREEAPEIVFVNRDVIERPDEAYT